jgi:hypothetical protein
MLNSEESNLTIDKHGNKQWKNRSGELHRVDGPAIEYSNGTKYWYQNGMRHRVDGPAIEYSNGTKYWYQNGKLHRIDGPAYRYKDGTNFWYLIDKMFDTKEDFFNALTDEEKVIALCSKDFHNA